MSKEHAVKLKPVEASGSKPFKWEIKYDNKDGDGSSSKPYPKVDLKGDSGPNIVTFTIEGTNDYTFAADPIWIQRGTTKPTGGVDSQIVVAPATYNNGKTLAIIDWNTWKGDLTYQLNIMKGTQPAPPVDPVITNGGGGGYEEGLPVGLVPEDYYSAAEYWTAAGIALAIGLILGAVLYKYLR